MLLTHDHADHVDGLAGVLRGRAVGQVQVGPLDEPAAAGPRPRRHRPRRRRAAWSGRRWGSAGPSGPLTWEVLAPGPALRRARRRTPTTARSCCALTVGPTTVLLTGDVEPEAQRDLLDRGVDVRADVLKVPHHGSDAPGAGVPRRRRRRRRAHLGRRRQHLRPPVRPHPRRPAAPQSFRTDLQGDLALVHRGGRLVVVTAR